MKITAEMVTKVREETERYCRDNPGIKNGEDFPEFARLLNRHNVFENISAAATAIGMISTLMLPRSSPDGSPLGKEATEEILNRSPLRPMILDIFYLGYRLGQRDKEVEMLNGIATTEPGAK